ncbi:MAG: caspase family protein [Myxococcales bacterium]|nr:caspase family protein [Myxococcales bacterium]
MTSFAAVVVGISDYPERSVQLPGVVDDVQRVLVALYRLGFEPERVRVVGDVPVDPARFDDALRPWIEALEVTGATSAEVTAAVAWLAALEDADDVLLYAACGGFLRGDDEVLATSDAAGVTVQSVRSALGRRRRSTLALDTSFRGSQAGTRTLAADNSGCLGSLFRRSPSEPTHHIPEAVVEMRFDGAGARPDAAPGLSAVIEALPTSTWLAYWRDKDVDPPTIILPEGQISPDINHLVLTNEVDQVIGYWVPFPQSSVFAESFKSKGYSPDTDVFAWTNAAGAWPQKFHAVSDKMVPVAFQQQGFNWHTYTAQHFTSSGVPAGGAETWSIEVTLRFVDAEPLVQPLLGMQGWLQRDASEVRLYMRKRMLTGEFITPGLALLRLTFTKLAAPPVVSPPDSEDDHVMVAVLPFQSELDGGPVQ